MKAQIQNAELVSAIAGGTCSLRILFQVNNNFGWYTLNYLHIHRTNPRCRLQFSSGEIPPLEGSVIPPFPSCRLIPTLSVPRDRVTL
jgi:hypothetical protein